MHDAPIAGRVQHLERSRESGGCFDEGIVGRGVHNQHRRRMPRNSGGQCEQRIQAADLLPFRRREINYLVIRSGASVRCEFNVAAQNVAELLRAFGCGVDHQQTCGRARERSRVGGLPLALEVLHGRVC